MLCPYLCIDDMALAQRLAAGLVVYCRLLARRHCHCHYSLLHRRQLACIAP